MRVLLIEDSADGMLDWAIRAAACGHDIRYHCRAYDPIKAPVGKGLVTHASDWRQWIRWCDLCVVGGNGKWMIELDRWRSAGVPIIGGCAEVAALELDRLVGMQAFRQAKIPVPPYRQCSTLREAMDYVASRDEGCAVKPCGDVLDKSSSCVGKTAKEILWRLGRWRKEGRSFPSGLIVQDRVQGVEFAVGAWVGPGGFADGWEENAEEKRLYPGGIGPNVGEAGTVMRLTKKSKLADQLLKPFEDYLVSAGYCGNVDVNTIITDDGFAMPLEWTCRFGWPAANIELALHDGDPIEFLAGLAAGKPPKTRRLDETAVGVVMALPPYPFGHEKTDEVVGVPVWGVTPSIEDQIHPVNMMVVDRDGQLATTGSYVLVATGTGNSVVQARSKAHRVLERLTVPAAPFWRNDIGSRLRSQLDDLHSHGYATDLVYA